MVACFAAAWASLAVPAFLGYDPWVWVLWGREATRGLPVSDGTIAWKPLPVLVTPVLALFGDAAPQLWLVLARAVGLFGLVLLFRLAARYAGPLAGAVAVGAFLLTPDAESRWLRHLLQGNIEPVTVALALWAADRHLAGRPGQALVLLGAAGLTRPEVWPLLLLYAGWTVVREPRRWWQAAIVLAAVPVLWFGGDRLVSGDALGGAGVAQVLDGSTVSRLVLALDNVAVAVILPVWVAAAAGLVWAAHRRLPGPPVLAAAAFVWTAEVVVMAGWLGYAALGRFLAPVSAVLCLLAGVAVGWAAALPRPVVARVAVALVLVAAAVPAALPRVGWLPAQVAAAGHRAAYEADLDRMVAVLGGRDRMPACGGLALDLARPAVEFRPALAWKLDVPLARVRHSLDNGPGLTLAQAGTTLDRRLATLPPAEATLVARNDRWAAYAQQCGTSLR
ncbi:hypothetical protein BJF78_17805 [Pseudonocardia sp. CNS-139]|nr:hypothetical protein BJF78_17805 [Pseudonocardia sp. CNS-139]